MGDFSGKFQYLASGGSVTQQGGCHAQFDAQTFTLTPESGAAMAFDLGDLDAVIASDYEIGLPLYTGNSIRLRQLGKAYETVAHDLLEAYRNRALQCLLLEDLREIARFPGTFELGGRSGPAEMRLFKSNLAVLPTASQGFQWRLADVDSISFNSDTWEITLQAGAEQLKLTKLAKRTEEFVAKVKEAVRALATQSAQALHSIFPFLSPDQLQATAGLMREGQSAAVAKLAAIHAKIPAALTANAVDQDLKPYYDDLVARSVANGLYAGFKLIRPENKDGDAFGRNNAEKDADAAEDADASAPDADADGPETLYWFFFPMAAKTSAANVVAWEASSRSGRATYFFRLLDQAQAGQLQDASAIDSAIRRLNRVLGMLNFRRRPIYLSDDDLERDPKYHRYAIAARRIPELRQVRANFLGRAIHGSHDAWLEQVKGILEKAGG
jgi:hypothetical protein